VVILEIIVSSFARPFGDIYRFFDQYLVSNVLNFARGFEVAIVLMAAMFFLLITVGITIREVKRLPKSYSIHILDLDGRRASIDGLRQTFSTYDVADSYARFYRQLYDRQYTFKVVGSAERVYFSPKVNHRL
jgi:hypothetical protein